MNHFQIHTQHYFVICFIPCNNVNDEIQFCHCMVTVYNVNLLLTDLIFRNKHQNVYWFHNLWLLTISKSVNRWYMLLRPFYTWICLFCLTCLAFMHQLFFSNYFCANCLKHHTQHSQALGSTVLHLLLYLPSLFWLSSEPALLIFDEGIGLENIWLNGTCDILTSYHQH